MSLSTRHCTNQTKHFTSVCFCHCQPLSLYLLNKHSLHLVRCAVTLLTNDNCSRAPLYGWQSSRGKSWHRICPEPVRVIPARVVKMCSSRLSALTPTMDIISSQLYYSDRLIIAVMLENGTQTHWSFPLIQPVFVKLTQLAQFDKTSHAL